jgi:hypothetical protein
MHRNGHYRIWDQKYLKRRGKTNTVRLMHMVEHPLEISIGSPNYHAVRNHSGVVVLPREGLYIFAFRSVIVSLSWVVAPQCFIWGATEINMSGGDCRSRAP